MASRFHIDIGQDEMEATATVVAGDSCTVDDLQSEIADAGICRGVLEKSVEQLGQQMANSSFTIERQIIAQGKSAREGKAGKLQINTANSATDIPTSHLAGESATAGGRAGGAESYQICVVTGQEVGRVSRCEPGEPGFTVKGATLESPAVEDPLDRLGAGLECTSDNLVRATSTGILVEREGEKWGVVPVAANKRILLTISDDKMQVSARLFPGEPGEPATVASVLDAAAVTHGIEQEACVELAQKLRDPASRVDGLLLAKGIPAQTGKDGYFEPDFPVGTLAGKLRRDGSIDFRDRSTLVAVARQDILGIYHGPTKGTPGHDVKGGQLSPTAGKEVPQKLGEGAKSGANNTVVATIDGIIEYQSGGTLQVNDAYEHRGDVDLKSGDLKMNGAIIVTGDVTRNAKVQATKGVVIKGMIDAGSVECDGPVTVNGGVVVEDKAWIRAGGDVTCRHTQGARIESQGTITIQQNAINSVFRAKAIVGESVNTRVLGGSLCAEEQIVVGEVGSELGARTVLSVGVPLEWAYDSVAKALGSGSDEAKSGPRSKRRAKSGKGAKAESAADIAKRLLKVARIEVHGTLHPGVVIEFGSLSMIIERESRQVSFRCSMAGDEPEIEVAGIAKASRGGE